MKPGILTCLEVQGSPAMAARLVFVFVRHRDDGDYTAG